MHIIRMIPSGLPSLNLANNHCHKNKYQRVFGSQKQIIRPITAKKITHMAKEPYQPQSENGLYIQLKLGTWKW